jgi:hypothetical protein
MPHTFLISMGTNSCFGFDFRFLLNSEFDCNPFINYGRMNMDAKNDLLDTVVLA